MQILQIFKDSAWLVHVGILVGVLKSNSSRLINNNKIKRNSVYLLYWNNQHFGRKAQLNQAVKPSVYNQLLNETACNFLLCDYKIEITSWTGGAYGIFARVGDVSEIERASAFLIQTTSVKIPYKPPAHEVIYLFHTYWVNISSFYLGKLLFI